MLEAQRSMWKISMRELSSRLGIGTFNLLPTSVRRCTRNSLSPQQWTFFFSSPKTRAMLTALRTHNAQVDPKAYCFFFYHVEYDAQSAASKTNLHFSSMFQNHAKSLWATKIKPKEKLRLSVWPNYLMTIRIGSALFWLPSTKLFSLTWKARLYFELVVVYY